jgi:putative ABC transport system permease protein
MYATRIRAKELALRKVLGASAVNILLTLSKEYIKLTFASFIVAAPIAYVIMQRWLENFFYRIEIVWWMLAVPGVLTLSLALLTVGFQSLKTALAKPIDSLRNE